ncbi:Vps51/Vps67-like protein [Elsinoe australis]|uniref:Conserved oligomeric Golgi complex subunit 1 n=1 Tax=Elsinoe australis TaxID=40998 RepID=A0A4U7ASJ3_9PEZI|nr:Vps51/Vps67-like protein [Elsinoe australis]
MANQAPDPKELKSWEDAFNYPIPVVRKFEQQLRVNINDNREKVRSLVGSSYRDLLGTADRIVDMNGEMQTLEDVFAGIGQKCNSRAINKLAINHAKLAGNQRDEELTRRRPAAEVALLQACLSTCQRLLKTDGDSLLAARLLLLARLLQNSASKTSQGARMISDLRLKVNTLRNRLLSSIDRRIGDPHISRNQMLDFLLAHALVTSSSLADVFRHLLRVREQSIIELAKGKKRKGIVKAVDLLFVTLEQVRFIFPKRMAETIERTMGPHLLSDPLLRTALSFDLDIYERWISPDIRNYVPWLRNNDLDSASVSTALSQWSTTTSNTITTGLSAILETIARPSRIAKLRETTIRHLLESDTKAAGFNKEPLLLAARDLFTTRLTAIITFRANSVTITTNNLLSTSTSQSHHVPSLWNPDLPALPLHRGAPFFRHQLLLRTAGHDDTLTSFADDTDSWARRLDEVRATIKDMQSLRWADSLDLDTDIDEDGVRYQDLFSKEDPEGLSGRLVEASESALRECLEAVEGAVGVLKNGGDGMGKRDNGAGALYLLRVLKVLVRHLDSKDSITSAKETAKGLYDVLAGQVVGKVWSDDAKLDYGKELFSAAPAMALWSGAPASPVQPGTKSFRLLRDVSKEMNGMGGDVWVEEAVEAVRGRLRGLVAKAVDDSLTSSAKAGAANGTHTADVEDKETEKDDESDDKDTGASVESSEKDVVAMAETNIDQEQAGLEERLTQMLFDVLYLQEVLGSAQNKSENQLNAAIGKTKEQARADDGTLDRLSKSAQAYHKRTYLLFGILAAG